MCDKAYVRKFGRSLWKKQEQEDEKRQLKKKKRKEGTEPREVILQPLSCGQKGKQIHENDMGQWAMCQNV